MPSGDNRKPIQQYVHNDKKRVNNPEVGLVTPETDKDLPKKKYNYDPHLDPQLIWAGKDERGEFEIPTVSLHVHEKVDPRAIIEKALDNTDVISYGQGLLFGNWVERKPIREAIEFYQHDQNWTNRLIAGDSLLVMNSMIEKEGMSEKIQMVYMDPPYGISYSSNFQPFTGKKEVKDGKDEDLSSEPEMVKAFRDTWELGIHSYLSYLRDRILLAQELLSNTGSIFIQISDQNVHLVRNILDEIFGVNNFVSQISFKTKKMSLGRSYLATVSDYILWYAKDKENMKYRQLFVEKGAGKDTPYTFIELPTGERRRLNPEERLDTSQIPKGSRFFRTLDLHSTGRTESCVFDFEFEGEVFSPKRGRSWKTNKKGVENLIKQNRLIKNGSGVDYVLYHDDFPVTELLNIWDDTQGATDKIYVVQTNEKSISRCLLMSTDPGDLVLDITCGSGTTAFVSEQWGRRWITCDTSRVAISLAKQRILTAYYDYYTLAHESEGIGSGLLYKTSRHITLGDIANNRISKGDILYDQPIIDKTKHRVTGPFTVESVPSPTALALEESIKQGVADVSITRIGETLKQAEWRDELLKTGIRGKGGQFIMFSRVEAMMGTRWVQAEGETDDGKRVLFVFGPEYAPMEQRQVEQALREAQTLRPTPEMIIFLAFQFDSEAAKDIDEVRWQNITLIRVQMNADLFTEDLKKKRSSDESFWLIGQPDIKVKAIKSGEHKGKYQVEVLGFDYYNTKTGNVESGGSNKIAMWMLDTDYDERSLFPTQIFFPMADKNEGWSKLAKNLKAELDEEKIEAFRGTKSLPFEEGDSGQIAVKIIDDRGIESLRVLKLSN